MDPNQWLSQLFSYGPYAVLVLFVFWVAPKQTKVFLDCDGSKDKLKRNLCGGIVVTCWLVVVLMVVFIYRNWPPLTVYQGDMGRHKPNVEFATQSEHLYLSQTDLQVNGTVLWNFAIIDGSHPDPDKEYRFMYLRDGHPLDYALVAKNLTAGFNKVSADPNDPRKLIVSNKATGESMSLPPLAGNETNQKAKGNFMVAYAEDGDYQYLVDALASDNAAFQAQAREQLRSLPKEVLENLLAQQNLPEKARQQIEEELKKRN